jgi:hypothetical protein
MERQEPTLANGPDTGAAWFRRGIYLAAGFFVFPVLLALFLLAVALILRLL